MLNFKDQIEEDLEIFINPDEFGEYHLIDRTEKLIVMDNNALLDNAKNTIEGTVVGDFLYYIKKEDIEEPIPESYQEFDGYSCLVVSCTDVGGLYKVILQMNGSNYGS